jgi:Zn-dependent M32 family carboxypeptidase
LTTVKEIDDDDVDREDGDTTEYITEDDVVGIFNDLYLVLQNAFGQLMSQVQQAQMAGHTIPEPQLQGIMKQELERALRANESIIVEKAKIDMDCFEEATWEFLNPHRTTAPPSTKVQTAVQKLQKLWQTATGEHVVGWTPFHEPEVLEPLDPDATVQAATVYFQALTDCMRRLISEYETSGKDLRTAAVQDALNNDFSNQANDAGEAALQTLGYTQQQFETSVSAHQSNPTVQRALAVLGMQQQQDFATMRI